MAYLKQRGDKWYVVWYQDGKKRAKSLETTKENVARKRLALWNSELEKRKWEPPKLDPPVDTFWSALEPWLKTHRSRAHHQWMTYQWAHFKTEFSKAQTLSQVARSHVEELKMRWVELGKPAVTINGFLKAMRSAYNHSIKLGAYNGANPFSRCEMIPEPKTEKGALTKAEFGKLYETACIHGKVRESKDIQIVFALGYYAGLRKEEIINVQWSWIDWKRKILAVRQDAHFTTKNKKDREIPLSPSLAKILKPFKSETGFIYRPEKKAGVNRHYRTDFKKAFANVSNKAGLQWVTPHILRHSFATNLIKTGASIALVSKWLGHQSIDVTVDVYGHLQGYHKGIEAL
jgi:integrase